MTTDYRPIACDRHSEFELLAMHAEVVELEVDGCAEALRGRVADVLAHDGAEYLVLLTDDGRRHRLRLDRLRVVRRLRDGRTV
jgi:transcriptional antiterminator Rof (Rho-off)